MRMYERMALLCRMDQELYKAHRMVSPTQCAACIVCMCMYKAGSLTMLQGLISFYLMCYGEEATGFGSAAALHDEDMVYAQYREAGPSVSLPLTPQTSPHTIPSHTLTPHCPLCRRAVVAWLLAGPGSGPVLL